MKRRVFISLTLLFIITAQISGFNFLINMFWGALPKPIRSAFKGEGLNVDELSYGYGNCNFASFGYFNSELDYRLGTNLRENYKSPVPTYFLYGGYIAHVSTPILSIIYPGWQLETEVGYGRIDYKEAIRDRSQLYVTGLSGFHWRIYKSPKEEHFSWVLNLGFGYKLHTIIKEQLYYNIQAGIIWIPNLLSSSFEYFNTSRGGNVLVYLTDKIKRRSKEESISVSINFLLKDKYTIKLSAVMKNLYMIEYKIPEEETKLTFTGLVVSLLSK